MNHIQLQYNIITNRVSILPIRDIEITFRGKLAQMLGFTPGIAFDTPEDSLLSDDGIPEELYMAQHVADLRPV